MASENIPRRRVVASLRQLEASLKGQRQQEIARAIELKNQGRNDASHYHTGLADGHNSMLTALRSLASQFTDKRAPAEEVSE